MTIEAGHYDRVRKEQEECNHYELNGSGNGLKCKQCKKEWHHNV